MPRKQRIVDSDGVIQAPTLTYPEVDFSTELTVNGEESESAVDETATLENEEEREQKTKSPFGNWSAKTAEQKGFKVLVYGPSGAGKTRFAATFPRPLFLDLEGGLRSTIQVKPVLRYPKNPKKVIEKFEQVEKFFKLVSDDTSGSFDTIVIDSLNELQLLIQKHVVGQYDANRQYEDQMTMADYGKANREFIDIIREFLSLPYHIVFTAVETPREYEEQQLYPKFIGKQVGPDLQRIMEMIGYCHVVRKGDKTSHLVSFEMSPQYIAKDRIGITNKDIPNDFESLIRYSPKESN